jgi:hypothetical protein
VYDARILQEAGFARMELKCRSPTQEAFLAALNSRFGVEEELRQERPKTLTLKGKVSAVSKRHCGKVSSIRKSRPGLSIACVKTANVIHQHPFLCHITNSTENHLANRNWYRVYNKVLVRGARTVRPRRYRWSNEPVCCTTAQYSPSNQMA